MGKIIDTEEAYVSKIVAGITGAFAGLTALGSVANAADAMHYVCADKTELTATFRTSPDSADIVFAGSEEKVVLPQARSADGGRYVKGDTEFWIKGKDATLTRGQSKTTCKS